MSVGDLIFTVPTALRYRTDGFASTGEAYDAFYANVPLGPVCSPGCGLSSFGPLPAGSVVVGLGVLSGAGAGAPDPDATPNTSVGGQAAVFVTNRPGSCGGQETITMWIPNRADGDANDVVLRACLHGPDLDAGEQLIQALLDSAVASTDG